MILIHGNSSKILLFLCVPLLHFEYQSSEIRSDKSEDFRRQQCSILAPGLVSFAQLRTRATEHLVTMVYTCVYSSKVPHIRATHVHICTLHWMRDIQPSQKITGELPLRTQILKKLDKKQTLTWNICFLEPLAISVLLCGINYMLDKVTKKSVLSLAFRRRWPQGQNTNSKHDSDAVSLRHKQTLPIVSSTDVSSAHDWYIQQGWALKEMTHTQESQSPSKHTRSKCTRSKCVFTTK